MKLKTEFLKSNTNMAKRSRTSSFSRPNKRQRTSSSSVPRRMSWTVSDAVRNALPVVASYAADKAVQYGKNYIFGPSGTPKGPLRIQQKRNNFRGTRLKQSDAKYVGPFRKPTKRGANRDLSYQRYGVITQRELSGRVTDSTCLYIGHSSVSQRDLTQNLLGAMIRHLLRKVGCEVVNMEQPIRSSDTSRKLFQFNIYDEPTGVIVTLASQELNSAISKNLQELSGVFRTALESVVCGDNYEQAYPHSIVIYEKTASADDWKQSASIMFSQINVQAKSRSVLKIQNQTVFGTEAGPGDPEGDETDDVNNQPIKGKVYEINSGSPKWKTSKTSVGNTSDSVAQNGGFAIDEDYGTVLKRVSQVAQYNNALKDPPHPKELGASKATGVLIQPGQIKSSTLYYSMSMDCLKFLKMLNPNTTIPSETRTLMGKCRLYALEKMINWGANYISTVYETEIETQVKFTFKKAQCISKFNYFGTRNNEQA